MHSEKASEQALGRQPHVCLPLLSTKVLHPPLPETWHRACHVAEGPRDSQLLPHLFHCTSMTWRIAALSHGLSLPMGHLRVRPGQVVMLAALNSSAMLEALLAICDVGCIATPVNHRWGAAELAAAMQLTQPTAILADAACWGLVQQALRRQSAGVQTALQPRVVLLGDACIAGPDAARGACSAGGSSGAACHAAAAPLDTEGLIRTGARSWEHTASCLAAGAAAQGHGGADSALRTTAQPDLPPLQLRAPADGTAVICFTSGTTGTSSCAVVCTYVRVLCVPMKGRALTRACCACP